MYTGGENIINLGTQSMLKTKNTDEDFKMSLKYFTPQSGLRNNWENIFEVFSCH